MELPQFIKEHNLFDRYKSHDGGTQLIPGTDATLQTMWEKELSYWDSYDHFKDVYTSIVKKHHKMIMYHCDILNNWDLMKHIMDDQTDDKKILWTSNIYQVHIVTKLICTCKPVTTCVKRWYVFEKRNSMSKIVSFIIICTCTMFLPFVTPEMFVFRITRIP